MSACILESGSDPSHSTFLAIVCSSNIGSRTNTPAAYKGDAEVLGSPPADPGIRAVNLKKH